MKRVINTRSNTDQVRIGRNKPVIIGGGAPIAIQSMTNTKTEDTQATIAQILQLEEAGCEIVRCAIPDIKAAKALDEIKRYIHIPLVADIHFDHSLAIAAMVAGADKIRINPGNIGSKDKVRAVVEAARSYGIPIRVGVNGGSLHKKYLEKYGGVTAAALAESALEEVYYLEDMDFDNIVISIKSSDVRVNHKAHRMVACRTTHPLHIGVTEAGGVLRGSIKSAVGLGLILNDGIGDTLRVSLTGDPVEEIKSAKLILNAMDLRHESIEVISCPTCGRTNIDLIKLTEKVEKMVARFERSHIIDRPLTLAVMGCAVNGPGEAREADIGVAGGMGEGLIFSKGNIVGKVPEYEILPTLEQALEKEFRQKDVL